MAVYFAHAASVHLIKIGCSDNIKERIWTLDRMSPVPVTLLGTIDGGTDEELALHARFAHLGCRFEWFYAAPELLAYIAEATGTPSVAHPPRVKPRPYNPKCGACGAHGHVATARVCPKRAA